jgi:hypothetical protein
MKRGGREWRARTGGFRRDLGEGIGGEKFGVVWPTLDTGKGGGYGQSRALFGCGSIIINGAGEALALRR